MRTGCGHTKKRGSLACDPVFCVILASPVKCPILKVRDVSQSLKYQDNSFTPSLVGEVFFYKTVCTWPGEGTRTLVLCLSLTELRAVSFLRACPAPSKWMANPFLSYVFLIFVHLVLGFLSFFLREMFITG